MELTEQGRRRLERRNSGSMLSMEGYILTDSSSQNREPLTTFDSQRKGS